MLDLFNQPQQWDSARSKIDVFKFYTVQVGTGGWSCVGHPAYNCGDNHLENFVDVEAFSKLGLWGIDIAIESFFAGPVMSYDPLECSSSEYVLSLTLDGSVNVIQSVQSNGGEVSCLAMDEPIRQWYPQYYYISFGINIDVAADMAELKSFCNAHDIEFGIIFFDTYWNSQYWEPDEYNDSTYYAGTMDWVNFVHEANLNPDHSIFQSWVLPYYTTGIGPNEIPVNLPENDSSIYSHTRLINEGYNILNSPPVGLPEQLTVLPKNFELHQNYPNPFNSETTISFNITKESRVDLIIFDNMGLRIKTLVDSKLIKGRQFGMEQLTLVNLLVRGCVFAN